MAVKRKKTISKKVSEAYQQAMEAEGAPVALDLLGFGSAIGDLIRGRSPKPAAKPRAAKKRAPKKGAAKAKTSRVKKKSPARKARRKK